MSFHLKKIGFDIMLLGVAGLSFCVVWTIFGETKRFPGALAQDMTAEKHDRVLDRSVNRDVSIAEKCDGAIDSINGVAAAPTSHFSASSLLNVARLVGEVDRGRSSA